MNTEKIDAIREARRALLAEGEPDTMDNVIARLGGGSKTTMTKYWSVTNPRDASPVEATVTTSAPAPELEPAFRETCPAGAEAPLEDATAAQIAQAEARIVAAQTRLEEARRHQAMLAQQHALARAARVGLVAALRLGVITSEAEEWQVVNDVKKQLDEAAQAVTMAEVTLEAAQRSLQAAVQNQAAAAYGATEEGAAILQEIDRLQHLYTDADARESTSLASYSHALGLERSRFQQGLEAFLATDVSAQPAPVPSAPTSGLSVEVLRQYYLDGLGRSLPNGVKRLEEAHYPLLCQVRDVLREESSAANREFMAYQRDDRVSGLAFDDPKGLPMRQVQQRLGLLHTALELVKGDVRMLQKRARDGGRTL